ncbi:hypothetical protein EJ03DRAFT_364001, partial [Teratosphaeria nubilosa]
MHKIAEGGFNKVFRLRMDNDCTLIARIPNRTSPAISSSLASEVATMGSASKILDIAVPEVLSWDSDTNNPVGSEYLLMREARGTPLHEEWESMSISAKGSIVGDLVAIERRFLTASFSQYGSIYFSDSCPVGCENFQLTGWVSSSLKNQAEDRYVIGPMVEGSFWDGEREQMIGVRGPWLTPRQYIRSICEREVQWLTKFADPSKIDHNAFSPAEEKHPAVHTALYEKLLQASDRLLPSDPNLTRSVLWHWDLHAPNIFVQDGKITDIIDWQDCWAGPLVLQARRPALVDYDGEVMLKLPPGYEDMEAGEDKAAIERKVERSILLFSYVNGTRNLNPELSKIFDMSHRDRIRQAITFAGNTWIGNMIPFRDILLRLKRDWHEIHTGQGCPFVFSQEEIDAQKRLVESWNSTADFWDSVSGLVKRDGFVQTEDYDDAFAYFVRWRKIGLETLEGEERIRFERGTRW